MMKCKPFRYSGLTLVGCAVVVASIATRHYGNQIVMYSVQEAIVDLIAALFFVTGFVLYTVGLAFDKKKDKQ